MNVKSFSFVNTIFNLQAFFLFLCSFKNAYFIKMARGYRLLVLHIFFDFLPPPTFFFLLLFFILISSDIPYLQADVVSPVVCSLFLLQHDLMCLSNNKREQRKRRGGRPWRGRGERMGGCSVAWYLRQSSTFFVICSQCGRKASHLLYYHQAMIRTALTTLLSQRQASALKLWMRVCLNAVCPCVCVRVSETMSRRAQNTRECLVLLFHTAITMLLWVCWDFEIQTLAQWKSKARWLSNHPKIHWMKVPDSKYDCMVSSDKPSKWKI